MWSSFGRDDSKRCLVDSWASTIHACLVLGFMLDSQLVASVSRGEHCFFVPFMHDIVASIVTSNFLLTFTMLSLYSPSSGSTKNKCLSIFEHDRVLTSRLRTLAFLPSGSGFSNFGQNFRPHFLRSGSCMHFRQSLSQTTYVPCESCPGIW